ncbi:hypothetical protein DACRYDRAFT_96956 [Dacryopinax primogenitus]|uniref:Nicotinamide N-methyltransferase n=1 Tax=Dacryopinax primogenitus (strain DJM 731) TaxID=1858805 RepID=M5FQW9_DACPD|nr:uncharacterized protein DACRYDRAFT_96956 [Dacryopinax primogenitus]EJT97993.1 hypothetical protein DACRYDRAFT_96956 [Dacryopinax primogenitus]
MERETDSSLDILSSSLDLLGAAPIPDFPTVSFGSLVVSRPPRAGKANTLLADQVFNPGLVTAERIEAGGIDVEGRYVLELGCGAGIPSLVAASLTSHGPEMVVLTDYPDSDLMEALQANVERNKAQVRCPVHARGYAWGDDVSELLSFLPPSKEGYDVLLLADLLHLTPPISPLLTSLTHLLAHTPSARAYITIGTYTKASGAEAWLGAARAAGLELEEWDLGVEWEGSELQGVGEVRGKQAHRDVKRSVRGWIGRWS